MHRLLFSLLLLTAPFFANAQLQWINVDSAYGPLPPSVHVFFTDQKIDTASFRAFYVVADLRDKALRYDTDTTMNRRLTPQGFFEKNHSPLVVVNGTFFSFESNRNLNVVVKDGRTVAHNLQTLPGRGKDTLTYRHPFASAIGISKKRRADVAWTLTDSASGRVYASQQPVPALKDSAAAHNSGYYRNATPVIPHGGTKPSFKKWKVQSAIGGGPVLLQGGEILVTNNEELKFAGKAINDKHPRTAMGYTADDRLIILVVEGRNPAAAGASLTQEARILKDLGCVEALNLDGGGSSCLLVNGKPTIRVSDKEGQRPVPAVFLIMSNE